MPTTITPRSGSLAPSYTQRVFETTGGGLAVQSPCFGCANAPLIAQYLVDKATSPTGREYTIQSAILTIPELRPVGGSAPFSDILLSYYPSKTSTTTTTTWITGNTYASPTVTACDDVKFTTPPGDPTGWYCYRQGTYMHYQAVGQMSVSFAPPAFSTQVSAAPTANQIPTPPIIATPVGSVLNPPLNTSQSLPPAP